jgi:hypothetical protein
MLPAKRTRPAGSRTTIAQEALAADGSSGASKASQTPVLVPAIRDWNPKALEALFGVVQDATANPKARRKAAQKIAEFLLPKTPKKPKVIPDEYGFLISPKLANAYRSIKRELWVLKREPTHKIPAIAAEIKKLEARSGALLRRLQMPYPTKYGDKEADKDIDRLGELSSLRSDGAALTEAQQAEEARRPSGRTDGCRKTTNSMRLMRSMSRRRFGLSCSALPSTAARVCSNRKMANKSPTTRTEIKGGQNPPGHHLPSTNPY